MPTDSPRPDPSRPPAPAVADPAVAVSLEPEPESGLLVRAQRLVPVARALVGKVRGLALVSAVSAVVLWGVLFAPWQWVGGVTLGGVGFALLVLALLLLPAGAAFLGYLMLTDVLDLPTRLRAKAAETTEHTAAVLRPSEEPKRGRLFGFFRAIWSARSLLLDSKGAWMKAVSAARLARLASLPFVLALLGAFALNFAVIGAAVLAVLLVLVF